MMSKICGSPSHVAFAAKLEHKSSTFDSFAPMQDENLAAPTFVVVHCPTNPLKVDKTGVPEAYQWQTTVIAMACISIAIAIETLALAELKKKRQTKILNSLKAVSHEDDSP